MTRAARLPSVLAGVLAALLLLGACSSDEGSQPGPSADAPSADGASSSAPPPTPVAFGFGGADPSLDAGEGTTSVEFGCTRYSDYLLYEQLSVDTPVVLRAIRSDGLEVGRSWITDDERQQSSSGIIAPRAPGNQVTDEPGWSTRSRLAGARLEPGTTYTFFVELTLPLGASQDAFSFDYTVDDRNETVDWPYAIDRVRRCPASRS